MFGRRTWLALGLAVAGVAADAWALLGLPTGSNPGATPNAEYAPFVRYYRALSLLLGLGLLLGLAAVVVARRLRPRWLRIAVTLVGLGGGLGGGILLLTIVGLCGPRVLWGHCEA